MRRCRACGKPLEGPTAALRLKKGSPCIDAADGDTAPELDIDGNARCDDPATTNTGKADSPGSVPYADMGAYEFCPPAAKHGGGGGGCSYRVPGAQERSPCSRSQRVPPCGHVVGTDPRPGAILHHNVSEPDGTYCVVYCASPS